MHLVVGYAPVMRLHGALTELPGDPLTPNTAGTLLRSLCSVEALSRFESERNVDFSFSLLIDGKDVRFRANLFYSGRQPAACLRIVPSEIPTFEWTGFPEQLARRLAFLPDGLVIITGVTGAGKTTTLAMIINLLNQAGGCRIITIEDPVEYLFPRRADSMLSQREVGIDVHNFADGLKYGLRQDPDVILVGEIRDEETARTAMQASMTGHLVFSTVHSKDTISAVFRLLDLKVEPYLVANSLDLVLAQRLLRVLCDSCKRPIPVPPGVATRLGKYLGGKTQMNVATGCGRCLKTGYRGRRAIFELLDVTDDLRDVILREPSIQAMKKAIEGGHFTTLAQSGWKLVGEGATTLEEVDHVAGQG